MAVANCKVIICLKIRSGLEFHQQSAILNRGGAVSSRLRVKLRRASSGRAKSLFPICLKIKARVEFLVTNRNPA